MRIDFYDSITKEFPTFPSRAIGFDRVFDNLETVLNSVNAYTPKYPPYNIIKLEENKTLLEFAVAGFKENEIEITVENQELLISGASETPSTKRTAIYTGIATRNFKTKFALEEHVEVIGANLEDGILSVTLEKNIPEEKLPKKITIASIKQIPTKK